MKRIYKLLKDFNRFLNLIEDARVKGMYFTGQGKV